MQPQLETEKLSPCSPQLEAKLAPWMRSLLEKPVLISDWLNNYSSPCHVVYTPEFHRNVHDLLSPLKARGLEGSLFFARKANKLSCFVSEAKAANIGVDTASINELRETLASGISPQNVVFTAIGKNAVMMHEAIAKDCLLVIENEDELQILSQLASQHEKQIRIGLRFSGFQSGGTTIFSRFGLPIADAAAMIERLRFHQNVKIEILHAHLDRYDTTERSNAARQLIQLADYAAAHGKPVDGIDLGGGILMRYLEHEQQWIEFQQALIAAVKGEEDSFTYLGDGLGFYKVGNEIAGKADFYPAWNKLSKERFIHAILDNDDDGSSLHSQLRDRHLKLYFEPGRALLDNVGMTFATVAFRKRDTLGNLLIGLSMNRMNLRPFRAEFCSDPIFIARGPRKPCSEGAFIVGNLCSEGDTIFRRKFALAFMPEPGDLIAFANSAGYLAHHMEIGTHGNSLPANLLFDPASEKVEAL